MNITDLLQDGNFANEQDSGYYEYVQERDEFEEWLFNLNEVN